MVEVEGLFQSKLFCDSMTQMEMCRALGWTFLPIGPSSGVHRPPAIGQVRALMGKISTHVPNGWHSTCVIGGFDT